MVPAESMVSHEREYVGLCSLPAGPLPPALMSLLLLIQASHTALGLSAAADFLLMCVCPSASVQGQGQAGGGMEIKC